MILDLRLPDEQDGLTVLRRVRAAGAHSPPVEIVTGDYALEPSVEHEIRTHGASITFKSLWLDDMLALVKRLLQQR